MIRASDLLGCVVHTESGKKVGRVHDLRAKTTESDCLLIGLMVGRGGMLVPWEAITHLEDGQIIIRD